MVSQLQVRIGQAAYQLFAAQGKGTLGLAEDGPALPVEALPDGSFRIFAKDRVITGFVVSQDKAAKTVTLSMAGHLVECRLQDRLDLVLERFGLGGAGTAKAADLKAPMPGLVRRLLVTPGQAVEKGTPLLVLEAMKMENLIKAPAPATISALLIAEGDKVEKGAVMIRFS